MLYRWVAYRLVLAAVTVANCADRLRSLRGQSVLDTSAGAAVR
jgi:hypothetical protein